MKNARHVLNTGLKVALVTTVMGVAGQAAWAQDYNDRGQDQRYSMV